MAFTISWHLQKLPLQALPGPGEKASSGIPAWCSVLYNMHHEGSSPGPGEEPLWHLGIRGLTKALLQLTQVATVYR